MADLTYSRLGRMNFSRYSSTRLTQQPLTIRSLFDIKSVVNGKVHRTYKDFMGLKIRLECYDKQTEIGVGEELSKDFGDDGGVIEASGMPIENNINNGGFDVVSGWVMPLQTHFHHSINLTAYDYQIAFVYRDNW